MLHSFGHVGLNQQNFLLVMYLYILDFEATERPIQANNVLGPLEYMYFKMSMSFSVLNVAIMFPSLLHTLFAVTHVGSHLKDFRYMHLFCEIKKKNFNKNVHKFEYQCKFRTH